MSAPATQALGTEFYVRDDWMLFRSLATISQKSGVGTELLRRLVAKELCDNALDAGGKCSVGILPAGGFYVDDDGPGIHGGPEAIAWLFSIKRALATSKMNRLPARGALGNGLRVVAGVALASGGCIDVVIGEHRLKLTFAADGETLVECQPCEPRRGTRVEVQLGASVPADPYFLSWAETAIWAAGDGPIYRGKPSPHFFDSDAFFQLLLAAGERTVRDVVDGFEGCSGKAGTIAKPFLGRRLARSLTFEESEALLGQARQVAKVVTPSRLQPLGKGLGGCYSKTAGTLRLPPGRGQYHAELPFTVEAFAEPVEDGGDDAIQVLVNRTPVAASVTAFRETTRVAIAGCGLNHWFKVGRKPVALTLNVQIPYMPITSDGKAPNLKRLLPEITDAVVCAARKCQRTNPTPKGSDGQKAVIVTHLKESVAHAGGGGSFSQRQLYYAVNHVIEKSGGAVKPSWGWFCKVLTEIESEQGHDIEGMYRDDRGSIYHPHLRRSIPLGTRTVEGYERPEWTFNKILYCEKEGLLEVLKAAHWPERHDCALLSSKGYASRAARDVIDLLGDTGEELLFFAIHDADAYGTCIYQALQEGTRARPARRVQVINLGLEPWQGMKMGLQVEYVRAAKRAKGGSKRKPVGAYVDDQPGGWGQWLQGKRIELNAMTTPQFIAWLDACMAKDGNGKLLPPVDVLAAHLAKTVQDLTTAAIRERILREGDLDGQVAAAMTALERPLAERREKLREFTTQALATREADSWRAPVEEAASTVVESTPIVPSPPARLRKKGKTRGQSAS